MSGLATVAKSWEQLQGGLSDGHLKDMSTNGAVGIIVRRRVAISIRNYALDKESEEVASALSLK